jgi:hypothetical protein
LVNKIAHIGVTYIISLKFLHRLLSEEGVCVSEEPFLKLVNASVEIECQQYVHRLRYQLSLVSLDSSVLGYELKNTFDQSILYI